MLVVYTYCMANPHFSGHVTQSVIGNNIPPVICRVTTHALESTTRFSRGGYPRMIPPIANCLGYTRERRAKPDGVPYGRESDSRLYLLSVLGFERFYIIYTQPQNGFGSLAFQFGVMTEIPFM